MKKNMNSQDDQSHKNQNNNSHNIVHSQQIMLQLQLLKIDHRLNPCNNFMITRKKLLQQQQNPFSHLAQNSNSLNILKHQCRLAHNSLMLYRLTLPMLLNLQNHSTNNNNSHNLMHTIVVNQPNFLNNKNTTQHQHKLHNKITIVTDQLISHFLHQ